MKHFSELSTEESGFRLADRIDIQERNKTKILVPFKMVDELAGWRDTGFEEAREFEIVGGNEAEEDDYVIQALYAKASGATLELIVVWENNLRVSKVTTTMPHTVFWQGERSFSSFGG